MLACVLADGLGDFAGVTFCEGCVGRGVLGGVFFYQVVPARTSFGTAPRGFYKQVGFCGFCATCV